MHTGALHAPHVRRTCRTVRPWVTVSVQGKNCDTQVHWNSGSLLLWHPSDSPPEASVVKISSFSYFSDIFSPFAFDMNEIWRTRRSIDVCKLCRSSGAHALCTTRRAWPGPRCCWEQHTLAPPLDPKWFGWAQVWRFQSVLINPKHVQFDQVPSQCFIKSPSSCATTYFLLDFILYYHFSTRKDQSARNVHAARDRGKNCSHKFFNIILFKDCAHLLSFPPPFEDLLESLVWQPS